MAIFVCLSSHQVHLKRTTLEKKAMFTVMNIGTIFGISIKTRLSKTTEIMFNLNLFSNVFTDCTAGQSLWSL